jgi:enoyl-CoA hydratase/carnithine racemase
VATVSLNHPPVNVLDVELGTDLAAFARDIRDDAEIRVIVWDSAVPDFFAAHADIDWMFDPSTLMELADPDGEDGLNPLQQLNERLRTLPQITIAKLRGYLRAGGAELAMTADFRFAAADATWLSQPESLMGIFPGGGGTQYLNRLVGRARGLEIALSGQLYDTRLAELYGWINRAVPDHDLDALVEGIARHIASLPAGVAAATKEAFDAAEATGPVPRLADEGKAHSKVYPSPQVVVDRMRVAMDNGAQTPDGERDLEGLLAAIPW